MLKYLYNDSLLCKIFIGMLLWIIIIIIIIIGSIILAILGGCSRELTQEEKWIQDQDRKCVAAKSRGHFIRETKTYECWNKPAFRRPKLVFSEKYM